MINHKLFYIAVTLAFVTKSSFAQITKHALFLGNSYTSVNNLPALTAAVATSAGDTLIYDSNLIGGYTLQQHSVDATSLSKIMLGTWDYVVLQEQSQLPSFPISQVETNVFPYARKLDSIINLYNPCAETMFYMTWGRKTGDSLNCPTWPPVCTYSGMDSLLHLRYMMMADSNNAVASPVGAVWKYIRQHYPGIELYSADYSHPSLAGSFAGACCFYTSMFRKNPMAITYTAGLPTADVADIIAAVKTVVYDSLLNWNIGKYDPVADFSASASAGNTITFANTSLNAGSYYWSFGDGDTSSSASPVHVYATSGVFPVMLIASHCDYADTITLSVNTATAGINNVCKQQFNSYPNPIINELIIDIQNRKLQKVTVVDCLGKVHSASYSAAADKMVIDFSSFAAGVYMVNIIADNTVYSQRVVKR
ncbi:MAG: T9SS type A sorting domain-containing protein [Bacteroidota bacterium]